MHKSNLTLSLSFSLSLSLSLSRVYLLQARGIDIPMLDNVINYHFPAQPKLFVHRVGKSCDIHMSVT